MNQNITKELSNFFLAGINYKKTDAKIRGLFAINPEQYQSLMTRAKLSGINELFVLSTCNRTEIYGFADAADHLIALLCHEAAGDEALFRELAYTAHGEEAVQHLFEVGAGLDSQILGDYEVISQVKNAAKFAKEHQCLGSFTERMINSVLQVSKSIKNETCLSAGTVSVAFAAVQYLKQLPDIGHKNILLFGIGKIGRNTCKNMTDHLGTRNVTLINRTDSIARATAKELGFSFVPYAQLAASIRQADVIIVATNAAQPTILADHLKGQPGKIIIDLSIPHNVGACVRELPGIKVLNVDDLSKVQDETLQMRRQEIPKAKALIKEHMQDFLYWHEMRKHAVVLQSVKSRLQEIHSREIGNLKGEKQFCAEDVNEISSRIVQKVINLFAGKVRKANGQSDRYLEVLSELFETPVKE